MRFEIKRAVRATKKIRMAIIGPSGSGKTFSAIAIARGLSESVLVIDSERGSASAYAEFGFDVLELSSFSPQTYVEAIKYGEQAGYEVIIIDSLSHAWIGKDGALEMVDNAAKRGGGGNSFGAWRDVTPHHNKMIDAIIGSTSHIIATLRAKTEHVQEKDDRGRTVVRKIGLAPVQRDGLEYEFDVVATMTMDNVMLIEKTRIQSLNGMNFPQPGAPFASIIRNWLDTAVELPPTLDAESESEPVHVPMATHEDLARCEDLRARASVLGYRTPVKQNDDGTTRGGGIPAQLSGEVQLRAVNARIKIYEDYIASHGVPQPLPESIEVAA